MEGVCDDVARAVPGHAILQVPALPRQPPAQESTPASELPGRQASSALPGVFGGDAEQRLMPTRDSPKGRSAGAAGVLALGVPEINMQSAVGVLGAPDHVLIQRRAEGRSAQTRGVAAALVDHVDLASLPVLAALASQPRASHTSDLRAMARLSRTNRACTRGVREREAHGESGQGRADSGQRRVDRGQGRAEGGAGRGDRGGHRHATGAASTGLPKVGTVVHPWRRQMRSTLLTCTCR